jgi:iron complex outermembrane receptor protein
MKSNSPLSYAIAALVGGSSSNLASAAAAADPNADSEGIQEIVVTAQRRTENMQEVPITIQALTA